MGHACIISYPLVNKFCHTVRNVYDLGTDYSFSLVKRITVSQGRKISINHVNSVSLANTLQNEIRK